MSLSLIPDVGQVAPDFSLKGPGGAPHTLSEWRGDKNVLLVFYPLAFSSVCSHQLPELERALPKFEAADTVVLGISVDSHYANAAFARSLGVTFPLLSDWKREASTAYGVLIPEAGFSGRASFLVDKQGRIAWRDVSENTGSLEDVPSIEDALAVLARS
jgi:peroxiredoxin (alkyl hydroperoxide reductase subunit C)